MVRKSLRAILIAALFLAACDSDTTAERDPTPGPIARPTSSESLVVGLVATMSGPDAWRGEDAFEGAQVGVNHINRQIPDDEPMFELVTLDDRGDPRRAIALVSQLATSDRTVGIVYAGPSEALAEVEGPLSVGGIPAILCFGDLHTAGMIGDHVFQVSPPIRWQATRIASYLFEDRRYLSAGVLVERSLFGRQATTALHAAFAENLGRRLPAASFADIDDIRDGLNELKRARVESIVVQGGPGVLTEVLSELDSMGALYRSTDAARIASARPRVRRARTRSGYWRPQVVGLAETAGGIEPGVAPPGIVAADTYLRGAHYLPVPSFEAFRDAFAAWWGTDPDGWEQRSFEAVGLIGWAAERAGLDPESDTDLALLLEGLKNRRFGGLPIDFGPSDHSAVDPSTVGLWVVPRAGAAPESDRLPAQLPWVPLARTFAGGGGRTRIPWSDWEYLFRDPPTRPRRPPGFDQMRYGVTTTRRDPIH